MFSREFDAKDCHDANSSLKTSTPQAQHDTKSIHLPREGVAGWMPTSREKGTDWPTVVFEARLTRTSKIGRFLVATYLRQQSENRRHHICEAGEKYSFALENGNLLLQVIALPTQGRIHSLTLQFRLVSGGQCPSRHRYWSPCGLRIRGEKSLSSRTRVVGKRHHIHSSTACTKTLAQRETESKNRNTGWILEDH